MPATLDQDSYDLWLDPRMENSAEVSELLKPFDARLLRCYPVSTRINQVANDDEDCSRLDEGYRALRRIQRPRASFSLAGFQVTLIGRFWVTPEVHSADTLKVSRSR
jgi:SOS response associated peptidase (SRAP)